MSLSLRYTLYLMHLCTLFGRAGALALEFQQPKKPIAEMLTENHPMWATLIFAHKLQRNNEKPIDLHFQKLVDKELKVADYIADSGCPVQLFGVFARLDKLIHRIVSCIQNRTQNGRRGYCAKYKQLIQSVLGRKSRQYTIQDSSCTVATSEFQGVSAHTDWISCMYLAQYPRLPF